MEKREFRIFCVNDGKSYDARLGMTLSELLKDIGIKTVKDAKSGIRSTPLAALVDNQLKQLDYQIVMSDRVEFVGLPHPEAARCYTRSLCFVLQKAVREMFPNKVLIIDHSLPMGLYCEIRELGTAEDGRNPVYFISNAEIEALKARMQETIKADLPFSKEKVPAEEALVVFGKNHQPNKAKLLKSLGRYFCSLYRLGDEADTFHGPLVPSTGCLKVFNLVGFNEGFCLQGPTTADITKVPAVRRQSKIASAIKAYSDWCDILQVNDAGNLNACILGGEAVRLINLSEAMQERKYAEIADMIQARAGQKRVIFIAGPSSSGKTSSSLRLAQQCKALGMRPKVIELDNYFVDRDKTPKDENGEYDFEALGAMDLPYLNRQINDLLAGKEVAVPRFDFKTGCRAAEPSMKLTLGEKDILIMEGIHALNPEMVSEVDQSRVFRVYVSALTSLNLDENNNISTSDNRLLRRMVRDNRVRGITPEETIGRWDSVRRGEERNIFPFQENADVLFNSALIYELPMLKYYAEPLLRRIQPNSPAYSEAMRLLKFLDFIVSLQPSEIDAIPPTSIMREFIGGQTL